MTNFLERIVASRSAAVEELRGRSFGDGPPVRDFRAALVAPGISVIAEIKRASPSKGELDMSIDPAALAKTYERGGARALSVLTEPEFFRGSVDDFVAARAATSLPVLWKDFLVDGVQVDAARASGADAILVIVRIVSDDQLREFVDRIAQLGMTAFVEVFDERDLDRALQAGAGVIGVNHRDLESFDEDPGATKRLRSLIPESVVLVASSAISTRDDVEQLEAIGVDAMLIGESLVRSGDPARKIRELMGA